LAGSCRGDLRKRIAAEAVQLSNGSAQKIRARLKQEQGAASQGQENLGLKALLANTFAHPRGKQNAAMSPLGHLRHPLQ